MRLNIAILTIAAVLLAVGIFNLGTVQKREQAALGQNVIDVKWASWKNLHKKSYKSPEEESYRRKVFSISSLKVAELNAAEPTAQFELNQFADLTESEFTATYKGIKVPQSVASSNEMIDDSLPKLQDVPATWDWSNYNAVTPIKNQGRCGSCWAFSTTGNLEGLYSIKHSQTLLSFSEQMLVDCSFPYGNYGCDGGLPTQAIQFVINSGIQLEADYPYVGINMMCQPAYQAFTWKEVTGQYQIPKNNNDILLQSAYVEPVSVGVDASNLQYYKGGIVTGKTCKQNIDHAVLVTGWGTDQGQNYWLVKNSWGANWGEKGYFRVERLTGTQPAPCAISALASYATMN